MTLDLKHCVETLMLKGKFSQFGRYFVDLLFVGECIQQLSALFSTDGKKLGLCRFKKRFNFLYEDKLPAEKEVYFSYL